LQKRAVKDGLVNAHQKLIGRILSKEYLKYLKPKAMKLMKDQGFFDDAFSSELHSKVVPWIYASTAGLLESDIGVDTTFMTLLKEACDLTVLTHEETLKKERARKDEITKERQRKIEEGAANKERRRKERAEKRRMDELSKLHEKVDLQIIKKGVEKEEILKQDLSNVHGYYQGKEIVGLIGGIITEMAMILTAATKALEGKDFLTEKNAYIFTVMYITQGMSQEAFSLFLGPKLVQLLVSKNIKLEEAHALEGDGIQAFNELYKNYQEEDKIVKLIHDKADELGIIPASLDFVRNSLLKLLLRKPTDPDPQGKNMAAKQKLKIVTLPEGFDKDLMKPQAIVRVQIPKPVVEEENPDDSTSKKPEEVKKKPPKAAKKDSANNSKKSANASRVDNTNQDQEVEDKVLTVKTVAEDLFVHVVHEVAVKELRNSLCDFIKRQFSKDLDGVDIEALKQKVEEIGEQLDEMYLSLFKDVPLFTF